MKCFYIDFRCGRVKKKKKRSVLPATAQRSRQNRVSEEKGRRQCSECPRSARPADAADRHERPLQDPGRVFPPAWTRRQSTRPSSQQVHSEHAPTRQKGKEKAEGFFKDSQFHRSSNTKMFLSLFLLWSHRNFKAFSTHNYFTLRYNQFMLCHLGSFCVSTT